MSIYLDTRGRTTLAVGICARCSVKYPLDLLTPDPNSPGLLVCPDGCKDVLDPYRMAPRQMERISVEHPRPDVSVALSYPGSVYVPLVVSILGVDHIGATRPWSPNEIIKAGDSITPLDVTKDSTQLPQNQWVCVVSGKTGATPPEWPTEPGVIIGDYLMLTNDPPPVMQLLSDDGFVLLSDSNGDGTVAWLNLGPYLL